MKNLLYLIVFISFAYCSYNRASYRCFSRQFDGEDTDCANSIIRTSDGGYAVAGWTRSFGVEYEDFWVLKLSANGVIQWQKIYGGLSIDSACSIIQTTDGGYAVVGNTWSFDALLSDIWLLKLTANGTIQWQRTYGGEYLDEAFSVIQTSDGGYAIAGWTNSFGAGDSDAWILKLASDGAIQWQRTYGGVYGDYAYSIIQMSDVGYAVAGWTESFGAGGGDFWVLKLASDGTIQWQRTYGGTKCESARSIIQTGDGGFAVAGYTQSYDTGYSMSISFLHNLYNLCNIYVKNSNLIVENNRDFCVLKLSSDGKIQWQKSYGTIYNDNAFSIIQTKDGGYAVAGESGIQFNYFNSFDILLLKLTSDGNIQWHRTYGGQGNNSARSIIQTSDEGYAVAGYTSSFGVDHFAFWVLKLNEDGFGPKCGRHSVMIKTEVLNATITTPPSITSNTNASVIESNGEARTTRCKVSNDCTCHYKLFNLL